MSITKPKSNFSNGMETTPLRDEEILERMTPTDKDIVLTYAKSGMKPSLAAKKFHISHNGVAYHLRSVRAKTGLDPQKFFDLSRLCQMIIKEREDYDRQGY